jgi:hypothetical protein
VERKQVPVRVICVALEEMADLRLALCRRKMASALSVVTMVEVLRSDESLVPKAASSGRAFLTLAPDVALPFLALSVPAKMIAAAPSAVSSTLYAQDKLGSAVDD